MPSENPNAPRIGLDDGGGIKPRPPAAGGRDGVMLEVEARPGMSAQDALAVARELANFVVDEAFDPVPMGQGTESPTYIVRGTAAEDLDPEDAPVVRVWRDTPIAPFRPDLGGD